METLLKQYHDLKEANASTDFPKILANVMHKALMSKFRGVNSPWRMYTLQSNMSDFKTHNRVWLEEAPDLVEVEEGGPYEGSSSITRKSIINDDLDALRRQPERFGRAAGRTLAKAVVDKIEGDGNTYDGTSLFTVAHGNSGDTALANTDAGIVAVSAAMTAIERSTDENSVLMGIKAKYLVVRDELKDAAMRVVNGTWRVPVTTTGGTTEVGQVKQLEVVVESFLTSSTAWYVMADPSEAPVVEVGFLQGKQEPDLLVKRADTVFAAGGGEDPWGYEFDDLFFKVRYDYALALAMYQGIYRGKA